MKKIYIITTFLFVQFLQAQPYTMVDLFNSSQMYGERGYYFRDTQGFFNIYKGGTWVYMSGNMTIQLRFNVITFTRDNRYKADALIGGIRIVKNGIEVLNSLYDVQEQRLSNTDYTIYSGPRLHNTPDCLGCTIPNQRLYMHYKEPDNDNNAFAFLYFTMHIYSNAQNQQVLRIVFTEEALQGLDPNYIDPDFPAPAKTQLFLPFGTYDFVKI